MMTKQEIFNKVYTHLITQGKQSITYYKQGGVTRTTCAYRGVNGTSCAVGCLILDEHYDKSIEGYNVLENNVKEVLVKSGVPTDATTVLFLLDLQQIHDSYMFEGVDISDIFKVELERMANEHNLTIPNLNIVIYAKKKGTSVKVFNTIQTSTEDTLYVINSNDPASKYCEMICEYVNDEDTKEILIGDFLNWKDVHERHGYTIHYELS